MCRLLVLHRGIRAAVNFHQKETRRIVTLLQHIEARDSRLAYAVAGIFDGGFAESVNKLGLHVDMNVDDEHRFISPCRGNTASPIPPSPAAVLNLRYSHMLCRGRV